jgi:hypothetical protein
MQDQGWRLDQGEGGAHVGLHDRPHEPLGGPRAGAGANQLPQPTAKPLVAGSLGATMAAMASEPQNWSIWASSVSATSAGIPIG